MKKNQQIPSFQLYYDEEFIAEIPMNLSEFLVGRQAGCHLRLIDESISREHCRLLLHRNGTLQVEDLASTNGTFLNDARIVKQDIKPGGVISLGRCTLVFHELDPTVLEASMHNFWSRITGRVRGPRYSEPRGKYILPRDNLITQFDAVSYLMVRGQRQADGKKSTTQDYLKRIPRLQIVSETGVKQEEVTRFSVSKHVFAGFEDQTKRIKTGTLIFAQPDVKIPFFKLPWKVLEKAFIPLILVLILTLATAYLLTFHIDVQMERFEKGWEQRLAQVEEKLRFADEATFATSRKISATTIKKSRSRPISKDEVWKRIEARPGLRNYLIFDLLDDILATEDITWSLDKALANLSKLKSVTTRLPSMKKLQVVLNAEGAPFDMGGLTTGRVLFLSEKAETASLTQAYGDYRKELPGYMAAVSQCAGSRTKISGGKVVLAFSINAQGKPTSVYINEDRSSKEPKLWKCARRVISRMNLPKPPGGRMSVVYTFKFAGPTKVTF